MHKDLKWLAENISKWHDCLGAGKTILRLNDSFHSAEFINEAYYLGNEAFTRDEWQAARIELGLENPFAACLKESDDTYASGMRDGYAIGTELQTLDREPWHIMDQILDMNLVHKKNLQMLKAQAKKCKDSESELESFASPEEEEEWIAAEKRMEAIGQNGNDGDHYDAPPSKYHVLIKGQRVDVYDVLSAYGVTNPADAHAIKKMLCPGKRGVKDGIQDRTEAIVSLQRAIELEQGR